MDSGDRNQSGRPYETLVDKEVTRKSCHCSLYLLLSDTSLSSHAPSPLSHLSHRAAVRALDMLHAPRPTLLLLLGARVILRKLQRRPCSFNRLTCLTHVTPIPRQRDLYLIICVSFDPKYLFSSLFPLSFFVTFRLCRTGYLKRPFMV